MTLVETVVVMTIVFLLVTLLVPVFSEARMASQATVCLSNLHQVGIALEIYHDDFGEYPKQANQAFLPYVGGRDALQCPEMPGSGFFNSYSLTAYDGPQAVGAETGPRLGIEKFFECREKRGSAFPLAFDRHHIASPEILHDDDQMPGYVLVLRASGAVDRASRQHYAQVMAAAQGGRGIATECAAPLYANNL